MGGYATRMALFDTRDHPVIADGVALRDLLDLVERAHAGLVIQDPALADALRGAAASLRESVINEPY